MHSKFPLGLKSNDKRPHFGDVEDKQEVNQKDVLEKHEELKSIIQKKSKEYEDTLAKKDIVIKKKSSGEIELKCDIPCLIYSSEKADK